MAEMVRRDLAAAPGAWIDEAADAEGQARRGHTSASLGAVDEAISAARAITAMDVENAAVVAVSPPENKLRLAGIEPATYGLGNRPALATKTDHVIASDDHDFVLADCLALLALQFPDLALLVKRWEALPETLRAGIVAMVLAARTAT